MPFVRVDNRLVHGQIIESWLPFTRARMILVVNDELAADYLRQEIMRSLGNKVEARRLAQSLDVPVVPGSEGAVSIPEAREIAAKIGFPIMPRALEL